MVMGIGAVRGKGSGGVSGVCVCACVHVCVHACVCVISYTAAQSRSPIVVKVVIRQP